MRIEHLVESREGIASFGDVVGYDENGDDDWDCGRRMVGVRAEERMKMSESGCGGDDDGLGGREYDCRCDGNDENDDVARRGEVLAQSRKTEDGV